MKRLLVLVVFALLLCACAPKPYSGPVTITGSVYTIGYEPNTAKTQMLISLDHITFLEGQACTGYQFPFPVAQVSQLKPGDILSADCTCQDGFIIYRSCTAGKG